MTSYLAKLFPTLRRVKPVVVSELPDWSEADARAMRAFLDSPAGSKAIDRIRYSVTAMCMDPLAFDEQARAERRAMALVVDGLQGLGDIEHWHRTDMTAKSGGLFSE